MKRILTTIAVSAFLAVTLQGGCTDRQVQSAGTIANTTADLVYANAEMLEQYRLDSGKISQAEYDQWIARANLLVSSVKLGTMTAQQLQAALSQLDTPEQAR